MAKDLFSNLDLNLLRTFIILHQEGNMRQAARRLFVTQPAISKSLQKLRAHFDHELFVKTHKGLTPTAYANDLASKISPLINDLNLALNSTHKFDPSQLTGILKVAISPHILSAFASEIFHAIRRDAPNVQVQLLNWSSNTIQELMNDEVQLGVNYEIDYAPKELLRHFVIQDEFHAYVRKDHPFKGESISLEQALNYEIATIIAADWNSQTSFAEKVIKEKGLKSNVAFRSELPSAVVDVVLNSDMLFPSSSLSKMDKLDKLRRFIIKVDSYARTPEVFIYYHHKNRENKTMRWLKSKIEETLASYAKR
ncbi:LysR family transcriptional regulator [Vibrio sp. YMD68]|uniref:LysR family transcriptional regulator n=1 Tax=Vibrio sp. YMD68 TaxID=3042300 RepID=UPI00249C2549|nr:LysR family transcriptional regulator [Vibrio sp. YMD68]WGV99336.1 LysR family transcriptional regulator [Vibrio sp. YMD68]